MLRIHSLLIDRIFPLLREDPSKQAIQQTTSHLNVISINVISIIEVNKQKKNKIVTSKDPRKIA